MFIIHALYEEYKPETFEGIEAVDDRHNIRMTFKFGKFSKDLLCCMRTLELLGIESVLFSSSVDNYQMDCIHARSKENFGA